MPEAPLQARSIAEIRLYLRVTACEHCGKGPLRCDELIGGPKAPATVNLSCTACGVSRPRCVEWAAPPPPASNDVSDINPTSEPSRIIDLGQWLVLVSLLANEAAQETNRVRTRELGIQTARCLDEALKFYTDAENDLPPPEAFFHEESRRRFHDSPEKFSRQRIVGLKSNLPQPYSGG